MARRQVGPHPTRLWRVGSAKSCQGRSPTASATQWEYFLARRKNKKLFVFRSKSLPIIETEEGRLQQVFNEFVEKNQGQTYEKFDDTDELRRRIGKINWNKEESRILRNIMISITTFLVTLIFFNFLTLISNAGTVLDIFQNLFIGSEPAIRYYLAADDAHAVVIAMPGKHTSGTLKIGAAPSVKLLASTPYDAWYKWPDPGPDLAQKGNDLPSIEFDLQSSEGSSTVERWKIELDSLNHCLRSYEGDCTKIKHDTSVPGLGWPMLPSSGWPRDAELGRVSLNSRYDDLVAGRDMIIVLGPLGFAALIAVMAQEVLGVGKGLNGAGSWWARAAARKRVDKVGGLNA